MSMDIPLIIGNGIPIVSNYENLEEYNNFIEPPSSSPNLVIALKPENGTKPWSPRSGSEAPQNVFIERDHQRKGNSIMDLTTPTLKSHKLEKIEELIESDCRYSSDNQQQIQAGKPEETDSRLEGGFGCCPKGRKKKSKNKKIKECCERCKQEINKDIQEKESRGLLTRRKSKEDSQCQNENVCNCKKKDMDDRRAKKLPAIKKSKTNMCKCKHGDLPAEKKPKIRERRQSDDVCPCKKEDMDDISVETISTATSCDCDKSGQKLNIIESLEKRIRTITDDLHNIREEIVPSNDLQKTSSFSKYFNELSTLLVELKHRCIQLQSSVDKLKGGQQIFRENTGQQTDNLEYVKVSQNTETTFIRKTNPDIECLEEKSQVSKSQHCNGHCSANLKHLPCIKEEISDIVIPQTPPELNCKRCHEVRICESCQKEFLPANINHMTEKIRRDTEESSNMIPVNCNCQKTYKNTAQRRSMIPHFNESLDDLNHLEPCMQEDISDIGISETPPEPNCKKCFEVRICESCQKEIMPAKMNHMTEKVCRDTEQSSKIHPANNNYQNTYKNTAQSRSMVPPFNGSLDDFSHLQPPTQEEISDIGISETPREANCIGCYEGRIYESCPKNVIPEKMNRMTEKDCIDTEESSNMLPANNKYQKTYKNAGKWRSMIPQPHPQVQSPTCTCSDKTPYKNAHCKSCKNSANSSHICADGGHEFNNQNKSKTISKQYGPKINNRDSNKNNKLYYRKSNSKSYNNNRMSFCNDYTCNWKSSRFQHAYPSSMSQSFSRSCACEPEQPKLSRRFEHSNHLDVSNGSPMSVNSPDMPLDSSNSISTKSSNESVLSHNLLEAINEAVKDFDRQYVTLTVISRPNKIFRINISISNTGKSVADIYATQSALKQAERQNLFDKYISFYVLNSKFPQEENNIRLGHSFKLINTETCQSANFKSRKNSSHKTRRSYNSKRTPKAKLGNYSTPNANRLKGGNSSTQLREEDDFRPSKGPFSPKGRYIDMSNNPYGQKQEEKSASIRKLEHQIHNLLKELQHIKEDLVPQADVNRFSNLSNRLEELNELLGDFRSNYHKFNNPNNSTEQAEIHNEDEYSLEAIKIEDRKSTYLKNTGNKTETRPSIQKRETIKTIKDPLPTERFLSSNNYTNGLINRTVRTSSNQCETPVWPEDNYAPPTSSECKQFLKSIRHPKNLFERHLLMMNDFRADAELRRQRLERKRREKAHLEENRNSLEHHQELRQEINEKSEDDEKTPTMRNNSYRDDDENTPILNYSPYRNMGGASASYGRYKIATKSTQTDFISSNMSDSGEKDNPKRNTHVLISETDSTSETERETKHYNSPDISNLTSKHNVIESNLGKTLVDVLVKHNTAPCTAVLTVTLEENNLYQINIWRNVSGKPLAILYATEAAIHEAESQKMFSKFLTYIVVTQQNTNEQKHKLLDHSKKIINQYQ